jgi:hypothetical protein
MWRGPPLAEFVYEPFATAAAARLEELRLVALERRIEADLAVGQGPELLAELRQLVAEQPLREMLRCQLMLALYRSGRQVEALDQARAWRRHLHDELGIDPGPSVRTLEERILRQESSLRGDRMQSGAELPRPARTVLVWADGDRGWREALEVCAPLATTRHELVLLGTAAASADLGAVVADTERQADEARRRGLEPRVAAFVAGDAGRDVARLASHLDVALTIRSVGDGDPFDGDTAALLDALPCDVALVRSGEAPAGGAVLAAFGGSDHDWAAIELAAWWASASGDVLELFGAEPEVGGGASRSLATAAVLVQRLVGVATRPVVGRPGAGGVEQAAATARLVIVGVSERWRSEGLGETRRRLLADVRAPLMIVRRGVRPGALAPPESLTAFSWSLG